jgi:Sec-independent protein secretion pathway component TatC
MYQLSYHFLEIRLRFIYLFLSIILTIITSYYYQFEILYIIGRPFLELDHKFILIDLTEALYSILRICIIISILLILPFFLYHLWSFYIPSRYIFERKTINKFSIFFFFMIIIELIFLYFVVFPKICEFLLSFEIISSNIDFNYNKDFSRNQIHIEYLQNKNSVDGGINLNNISIDSTIGNKKQIIDNFNQSLDFLENKKSTNGNIPVFLELTARLESYVNLSIRFYVIMLTLFQIPFLVVILYYRNIIDCYILCKIRKFFLFSSLLISAFISPPDILSQCIITILLFFFYEFLIFIGLFHDIFSVFTK